MVACTIFCIGMLAVWHGAATFFIGAHVRPCYAGSCKQCHARAL